MVFPLFKVWNSLQQWEDVEVTIHENDVVFYNSEMCINSGKMMEMTYKGYPTNNSIVIRTSQSELPDLLLMLIASAPNVNTVVLLGSHS